MNVWLLQLGTAVALVIGVNAVSPLAAAGVQAPAWRVVEERRVGPPQFEFGSITDVALDGAGRLWIVDGMSGELFVAAGGEVRRVATEGRGPGELMPGALELVILPGDTVLVVDPDTRRMHRFSSDGVYARTVTVTGDDMTGGWKWLPAGGLAMRVYPRTVSYPGEVPQTGGDPVRAVDPEGRAGEVLAMLPPTESFRMGSGPMPVITLLAPQPLWTVDGRGNVLVASTHRYHVTAYAPDGGERVVVSREVDPGRVDDDVADAARELLREAFAQRQMPPGVLDQMVAAAAIAEDAPVIGGLMAGPGNTVWVQDVAQTGAELLDIQRPGGRSWRVFDAQGRPAGTAMFAVGAQPVEWRGDRLVAIARDALGRTSAVVLRVEAPGN